MMWLRIMPTPIHDAHPSCLASQFGSRLVCIRQAETPDGNCIAFAEHQKYANIAAPAPYLRLLLLSSLRRPRALFAFLRASSVTVASRRHRFGARECSRSVRGKGADWSRLMALPVPREHNILRPLFFPTNDNYINGTLNHSLLQLQGIWKSSRIPWRQEFDV